MVFPESFYLSKLKSYSVPYTRCYELIIENNYKQYWMKYIRNISKQYILFDRKYLCLTNSFFFAFPSSLETISISYHIISSINLMYLCIYYYRTRLESFLHRRSSNIHFQHKFPFNFELQWQISYWNEYWLRSIDFTCSSS